MLERLIFFCMLIDCGPYTVDVLFCGHLEIFLLARQFSSRPVMKKKKSIFWYYGPTGKTEREPAVTEARTKARRIFRY